MHLHLLLLELLHVPPFLKMVEFPTKFVELVVHVLVSSTSTSSNFKSEDSSNITSLLMMSLWAVGSHNMYPLTPSP
jgi:hypothetical protein